MVVEDLPGDREGPAAVTTAARPAQADAGHVPSEWLDRLLRTQCELRATVPVERTVERVVEVARANP